VKTGWEDVGKHGQIAYLGHRLIAVGELEQVEVGIRHHDVLGLPADPAAHVDVTVCRPSPRPRELDVWADLDDLAEDLVSEHEACGSGGTAAHHLQDHAVVAPPADIRRVDTRTVLQLQLRIWNVADLNPARFHMSDRSVACHLFPSPR